jgi:hypothetical protein
MKYMYVIIIIIIIHGCFYFCGLLIYACKTISFVLLFYLFCDVFISSLIMFFFSISFYYAISFLVIP